MARFLASLRKIPNVSLACVNAGISRVAAYAWRDDDEKFAAAWEDALSVAVGYLEEEARRRAVEGVQRVRFHKDGAVAEAWTEYSDTLLLRLLAAHHPKYRRVDIGVDPGNLREGFTTWMDLLEGSQRAALDRPRRGQERAVRAPRQAAEIGPGRPLAARAGPKRRGIRGVRPERRQEAGRRRSAPPRGSGASARA